MTKERPGQYVRDHYGVPAFIGRRVRYTGGTEVRDGRITGFDGAHLLIRFDDETRSTGNRFHPTWMIEYL